MNSQELINITEKYGAHNYKPLQIMIVKAEGCWVYDAEENKYLDMLSCYSALNMGHRHPRLIQAAIDQMEKCTLTSRAFYNDQCALFFKELAEFSGKEMVLPMNSGAEAVETAVKMARRWGYQVKGIEKNRAEIIVCSGNFHGRTTTCVSFSSDEEYKEGFGPFTPGFVTVPYGDSEALKKAINKNTAAFLVEPIQGEAGVVVPPATYLKECYEACKSNNVLFISDEIQTGFGRTGKRFATDHANIIPDCYILGKALGGGIFPVSAVAANKDVLGVFNPGSHGSTFGGNPLGTAIARTAIKILVEEKLAERSMELGNYLMDKLKSIKSDLIEDIRGKGLFIGILLKKSAGPARPYCEKLFGKGILCKETHDYVIRLAPPLTIKKEELDFAVGVLKEVLEKR